MNKVIILLAITLISFNQSFAQQAPDSKTVNLTADNWCPYTCHDNAEQQGLFVDIARAVFEADYQVNYKSTSWTRSIEYVDTGKYDVLLGANDHKEQYATLAKGFYIEDRTVFAFRKDKPVTINRKEDLAKYHIGKIKGYIYDVSGDWEPTIQEHPNVLDITSRLGEPHLMELLSKGRIDIAVVNKDVANYYLRTKPWAKDIAFINKDIMSKLYLGFAKTDKAQALQTEFNKRIEPFIQSPKLQAIFDKYGVEVPNFD